MDMILLQEPCRPRREVADTDWTSTGRHLYKVNNRNRQTQATAE